MTCLLCTSPAVADCLCVACGAKLWACELWRDEPKKAAKMFTDLLGAEGTYDTGSVERDTALLEMTPGPRRIFMQLLEAARAKRAAKEGER